MIAPPPPLYSVPVSARKSRYAHWAGAIAAALFIWLSVLSFPLPPAVNLDASWQMVINRAWSEQFVFGRDIVYTYGPWGWLTTQFYDAATFVARLSWELAFKGLAAGLCVLAALHLAWPRRIGFITAALLLGSLFPDTVSMLVIAGLAIATAQTRPALAITAGGAAFLGFLALQKITYLFMLAGGLGCIALHLWEQQERQRAGVVLGAAFGGFLAGWLLARQPLSALPDFLRAAMWVSSGYSEAMYFEEPLLVFGLGLLAAGIFLVLVWASPRRSRLLTGLMVTGFAFVGWKHGFVRADGHTLGFFILMVFAGLAAPWLNPAPSWHRTVASWSLCIVALIGASVAQPGLMKVLPQMLVAHVNTSTAALSRLPALEAKLKHATETLRTDVELPVSRARIGDATVDQFGYEQAVVLLNRFSYHPRPVFQSFHAYSGPLATLNAAAGERPTGPAFTLARLQSIDWRYPALDDARVLRQLIVDHTWVLSENGYLLLQRRPVPSRFAPEALAAGRLRYGTEEFVLPTAGRGVWAELDAPFSWLGWLRTLFYKPPQVTLVLRLDQGAEQRFRLIVPAARAGFLLSPFLDNTADLQALVERRTGRRVKSFRLELRPEDRKFFLARARYQISTLPELTYSPVGAAHP